MLDDLLMPDGVFRSAAPEVEVSWNFTGCRRTVVGGSVCWVLGQESPRLGIAMASLLLSVWLLFPTSVHQGLPHLMFEPRSFDVVRSSLELTQLPAQSQKCVSLMSFFQLLRHFKGVVEAYEKNFFQQYSKSSISFILMSRK